MQAYFAMTVTPPYAVVGSLRGWHDCHEGGSSSHMHTFAHQGASQRKHLLMTNSGRS